MLGHNNGPPIGDIADSPDVGRRFYWQAARKKAWRTPPIEIVRLRDRAAQRIGLTYNDFTSILLDRGRRPSAVIFTLRSLVRSRRGAPLFDEDGCPLLMPGVEAKLRKLGDCSVFIMGGPWYAQSADVLGGFERRTGRLVTGTSVAASTGGIIAMLSAEGLPPGQSIMVGDSSEDEACARAAGVAKFFWAWHYFGEAAGEA